MLSKKLFKRHRIRASIYHIGAVIFTLLALIYYFLLSNPFGWFDAFCVIYFIFDYLAEMFDPHPDIPGPGFAKYFHRMYDGDTDDF